MSSVAVDEDTATDGQAADTEDEIQRQTNKIRREIEKERKQKVKIKHPAPPPVKMRTHPDVQILANSTTGSDSISGYGMSPTMAAIAAANHSYHQALYTPSLSSCASTSTPNLASAALYEAPSETYQSHHQMAPLSPEQYYQQITAALRNAHHMSPKVGCKFKKNVFS